MSSPPTLYGDPNRISANELRAFATSVRAEVDAALARLAMVDPDALRPNLRREYERVRAAWEQLRTMTEDEALGVREAACLEAGQELTPDELRGLVGKQ